MYLKSLDELKFDNRFTRELPADPKTENRCRQVKAACFSKVKPLKVCQPKLLAYSREVADDLNISQEVCQSAQFTQVFSGNNLLCSMDPYACCYGGHQFGRWAGQLGDGRAINLGEIINKKGQRWALQLKGAGPTPYSRAADGLAVLRSSMREFLCSEAMHHLGVPTTRALSLCLTGEQVMRDMLYDGHAKLEPGAVVCRVAPSFTRFGSFQIFASRGELKVLQQLLDYTIKTDFPHLGPPSIEVYLEWFSEVCQSTLEMILHWQRVGFVHGVMNTDNMSILGLTIDYGPYGWLEGYDPNWTPNTTDAENARYRFGNQPQVALWNLSQLAQALLPLVIDAAPLQAILDQYSKDYQLGYYHMMAKKLGLEQFNPDSDKCLIDDLQDVLQLAETDMTLFFRSLALIDSEVDDIEEHTNHESLMAPLMDAYYQLDELSPAIMHDIASWLRRYIIRLKKDKQAQSQRRSHMNQVNPKYVLRNYLAQLAINKSESGDHCMLNELLELLRHPYDEQPEKSEYAKKRPEWARHKAGCSMLSCSS